MKRQRLARLVLPAPRRTIVLDTAALLAGFGPAQAGSGGVVQAERRGAAQAGASPDRGEATGGRAPTGSGRSGGGTRGRAQAAPRGAAAARDAPGGAATAPLGERPRAVGDRWVISPAVQAEVRPGGPTGRSLERALAAGLEVVGPSGEASQRVDDAVARAGEELRVSYADREVLALALDAAAEGPVEIWSDDYAVQNLARILGVPTRPVLTEGIREEASWYVRCTGCARYPDAAAEGDTCPVCGSPLKRTRKAPGRSSR